MATTILKTEGLTKTFKGFKAVDGLNIEIQPQMVYGLLGPNGSGKTTTLGMLLGVIRPSEGSFSWFENGQKDENRKRIGALLETPNFYPYLTAVQNLEITAKIKDIPNPKGEIERVLKVVDLFDRKDTKFSTYSLGMKQRLAIGATLLGDPELLVLDEPTNGLDPQGIKDIRDLIIKIGKEGKTILIASHILDEIEKVCTHCAILRKGQLIKTGTIAQIIGNEDVQLIKAHAEDMDKLRSFVNSKNDYSIYRDNEDAFIISAAHGMKASDFNKHCFDNGIVLNQLSTFNETLEDQFLQIVKTS
ncbi:MAG: ATP-binding cassette domain-containing protein [bacterium]|nr:ATP-binding cassette domain-containing protein [bacterium]